LPKVIGETQSLKERRYPIADAHEVTMGRANPLLIGSPLARRSDIAAPCSNAAAFCHLDNRTDFWQML
jgi:hypothetical protein